MVNRPASLRWKSCAGLARLMLRSYPGAVELVLGKQTKQERRATRQSFGLLRHQQIQPMTLQRYSYAFNFFWQFMINTMGCSPESYEQFDRSVAEYIEYLWEDGATKGLAQLTVSAVAYFLPACRRSLSYSWRMISAWQRCELPTRATPFTVRMLGAVCGVFWAWGHERTAAFMMVAFHCLLRTGEMFQILGASVLWEGSTATLKLGPTKTSKRSGAEEHVNIIDPFVIQIIQWLLRFSMQGQALIGMQLPRFRILFKKAVLFLGLNEVHIAPYSIRRGGATYEFASHGLMDKVLVRGRWANTKTARMYINEGMASWVRLELGPQVDRRLQTLAAYFHTQFHRAYILQRAPAAG